MSHDTAVSNQIDAHKAPLTKILKKNMENLVWQSKQSGKGSSGLSMGTIEIKEDKVRVLGCVRDDHHTRKERHLLCEGLGSISAGRDEPWAVEGDFNIIESLFEYVGQARQD
ncbi:hypothetical protein ACH5RR_015811 [Cinchona calisaya]|uniref:Uncharacterized protein n=1 Tax=Cinchona calisaya TaxID=153742 RepID=A0ABD2ZXU1_9GENT